MANLFNKFRRLSSKEVKCASCVVRLTNGRDVEILNNNIEESFNGKVLFNLLALNLQLRKDHRYFALVSKSVDESAPQVPLQWVTADTHVGNLLQSHRQILLRLAILPKRAEEIQSSFVLELIIFYFAALHEPVLHEKDGDSKATVEVLATVRKYLLEASNGIPMEIKRVTDAILKTADTKREFINRILQCHDYTHCWYDAQETSNFRVKVGLHQDELLVKEAETSKTRMLLQWSQLVEIVCKKFRITITYKNAGKSSGKKDEPLETYILHLVNGDAAEFLSHHMQLHLSFHQNSQVNGTEEQHEAPVAKEKKSTSAFVRMRSSLSRSFHKKRRSHEASSGSPIVDTEPDSLADTAEHISHRLPSVSHFDPRIIVDQLNSADLKKAGLLHSHIEQDAEVVEVDFSRKPRSPRPTSSTQSAPPVSPVQASSTHSGSRLSPLSSVSMSSHSTSSSVTATPTSAYSTSPATPTLTSLAHSTSPATPTLTSSAHSTSPVTPTLTSSVHSTSPVTPTLTSSVHSTSPVTPTLTSSAHSTSPVTPTLTSSAHSTSPAAPTLTSSVHSTSPVTPTLTSSAHSTSPAAPTLTSSALNTSHLTSVKTIAAPVPPPISEEKECPKAGEVMQAKVDAPPIVTHTVTVNKETKPVDSVPVVEVSEKVVSEKETVSPTATNSTQENGSVGQELKRPSLIPSVKVASKIPPPLDATVVAPQPSPPNSPGGKSGLPTPRRDSLPKSSALPPASPKVGVATSGIPAPKVAVSVNSAQQETNAGHTEERRVSLTKSPSTGIPSPSRSSIEKVSTKAPSPTDGSSKLPVLTKPSSEVVTPTKAEPPTGISTPSNIPKAQSTATKLPQFTGIPRRQTTTS